MQRGNNRKRSVTADDAVKGIIALLTSWSEPTLREVVRSSAKELLRQLPELQDEDTKRAVRIICEELQEIL